MRRAGRVGRGCYRYLSIDYFLLIYYWRHIPAAVDAGGWFFSDRLGVLGSFEEWSVPGIQIQTETLAASRLQGIQIQIQIHFRHGLADIPGVGVGPSAGRAGSRLSLASKLNFRSASPSSALRQYVIPRPYQYVDLNISDPPALTSPFVCIMYTAANAVGH